MFDINDKNLIMDMLDRMYHYDEFRAFLEEPDERTWCDALNIQNELDIHMYSGATKGVVIMDDCNFVIKMPFDIHDFDYCKAEWRNYLMAEQEGIGDCFAETHFVCMFHGMPIYAQEYCDCDEYTTSDRMWDSSYRAWLRDTGREDNEENRDDFAYDYDDEDAYFDMCVEEWGREKANKFYNFCYDNMITDLHSGNWACGSSLVAVDFSGFGDISRYFDHDEYVDGSWEDSCDRYEKWFKICDLALAFDAAQRGAPTTYANEQTSNWQLLVIIDFYSFF